MSARFAIRTDGYVPVVDLGAATAGGEDRRRAAAAELDRVCRSSGFFVVVNHGVPAAVTAAVDEAVTAFFGRPAAEKDAVAADPADPLLRGYGRDQDSDRLETFVVNRAGEPGRPGRAPAGDPGLYRPNRWPDLPGFRDACLAYLEEAERLALRIMGVFALALELPEEWFADKFVDNTASLAANLYPGRGAQAVGGTIRKIEHTDWGTLTVLYKDDSATGLQVFHRGTSSWQDVPAVPDSFVINIGDLMAHWTNDRWASTLHRVVHPADGTGGADRRSIAFFHQPGPDTVIECIPSCLGPDGSPTPPPITFRAFLRNKARRAYIHRLLNTP